MNSPTQPVFSGSTEFLINSTSTNDQSSPAIATLQDGSYVVTWVSWGQDGSLGGLFAQRFGVGGIKYGPELAVNTRSASSQESPGITALKDGGYVITWVSNLQDGAGWGIYLQQYNASGIPVGSEALVNTTTASDQTKPSITGLDDGGFVITWNSLNQDGGDLGLYSQRFSRNW